MWKNYISHIEYDVCGREDKFLKRLCKEKLGTKVFKVSEKTVCGICAQSCCQFQITISIVQLSSSWFVC
jgi:hypothetical protein